MMTMMVIKYEKRIDIESCSQITNFKKKTFLTGWMGMTVSARHV
jgi:hypothetical protein